MIAKRLSKDIYLLRIEPNEEIFESILNFAKKYKINFGFFFGIGAGDYFEIGRYNERTKDYDWKKIKKQMEIISIIGNLTIKENKPYLHIHASLSDKNLKSFGGHLKSAIIFPTCELLFFASNKKIERKFDELTKLYLIF